MALPQPSRKTELEEAFGLFRDVSERLADSYHLLETRVAQLNEELAQTRAEHEHSRSENGRLANRFEHLLSVLPAGVVVLDRHGRVQDCNPMAGELLGEPLRGCAWNDIIARAFDPRPNDGHEISLRDGRLVSVATRSLDPEPGQIVLVTDLTSTRRLQDQVARHERLSAMGEMTASLAHQVRTPLAAALLYASHLARPQLTDSDRLRAADRILSRLRHLERLVSDMLVFARGGGALLEQVAVSPLLAEIRQALEPQLAAAGCRLQVDDRAGEVVLQANREALAGAVLNLVTNAIEACGAGGDIRIEAQGIPGEHLDLRVRDNGPGIAPEIQARIFEPFFTTRAQGTGLGLAVVQSVARAHAGSAWVQSVPGEGATFGLRLPARKPV